MTWTLWIDGGEFTCEKEGYAIVSDYDCTRIKINATTTACNSIESVYLRKLNQVHGKNVTSEQQSDKITAILQGIVDHSLVDI